MRPIKQDALTNDNRLLEMAIYQETKGQTCHCDQNQIINRMKEYKLLIKKGEATIDSLEDQVFMRFGVVNPYVEEASRKIDSGELVDPFELGSFIGSFLGKGYGVQGKSDAEQTRDASSTQLEQGKQSSKRSKKSLPPPDLPKDLRDKLVDDDFNDNGEDIST